LGDSGRGADPGALEAEGAELWIVSRSRRNLIQPSEFLLGPDRRVLRATYSSGPIGPRRGRRRREASRVPRGAGAGPEL